MANEMIRMAGRGDDGLAKAIKTDNDGNLGVKLAGSILAKDPATGETVEVTAVQDNDGEWVFRMVDASPVAYDQATDTIKTKSKKSLPAIQTLSQTVNITAGSNKQFTIAPPAGEIWHIKLIGLDAPAPSGASSGSHVAEFYYTDISTSVNQVLSIANVFGSKITIRANVPFSKSSALPASDGDFSSAIRNISCSASNPLIILYTNLTNVAQTGTIGLKVVKEIEYVG
jgi:hypothetical protein